ncbi:unnamed protein product [Polarella glacialis]|uniref:Uncharacterized protein n=1 Tax=Polarella glacialis TaxID=89957 RepID=A0A813HKU2_POLGL|nr:unnamed protein product [Polarella glacialis]
MLLPRTSAGGHDAESLKFGRTTGGFRHRSLAASKSSGSLTTQLPELRRGSVSESRLLILDASPGQRRSSRREPRVLEETRCSDGLSASECMARARQILASSRTGVEAAERELDERGEALAECREGLDACGRLLMATGYRLEERHQQLWACQSSPSVVRTREKGEEATRMADQAVRRTLLLRADLADSPARRPAQEDLFDESPRRAARRSPEKAAWHPMDCLNRRSTTDVLIY